MLLAAGAVAAGVAPTAPSEMAQPRSGASRVIFASNRDGDTDGYAIGATGRRLAALTADSQEERDFVVSRDGRHLAFRRTQHGNSILYVADAAGRHQTKVVEGVPAGWSPDGTLLAFFVFGGASGEANGIAVVQADGKGVRTLVRPGGAFTEFEGWSADGRELAFTHEVVDPNTGDPSSELRTVDLAGAQRLVYAQLGEMWFSASWSPNGRKLAYRRFAHNEAEIAVFDPDSGTTTNVAGGGAPVWSPDGSKLLYSSRAEGDHGSLTVTDLASGRSAQLVRTAAIPYDRKASYAWSPSGNRVAWLDSAGLFDVGADGIGRKRLRRATWIGWPPGVGSPIWSPDGTALAFEEDGLRTIRADGTGLKTLASRGSIEVLAWVSGSLPAGGRDAARLPPLERAAPRLLRARGRIKELVAAGATAAIVSGKSRLDCVHVLAWSPRAATFARARRPVPCDPLLPPRFYLIGGLEIDGTSLAWSSDWTCGNTECDRVGYEGLLRRPGRLEVERTLLTVPYEGPAPKLPCVVCPTPNPTSHRPDVVREHAAVFVRGRTIVIRLLRTRATRRLHPPGVGRVLARLTRAGLFYGYSLAGGSYPGRVVFVPLDALS